MNKVWLTRYALSDGISHEEVEKSEVVNGKTYLYLIDTFISYRLGKDVFTNKNEAMAKAEEMRIAKIKSLKKQIEKLEKLKFEV